MAKLHKQRKNKAILVGTLAIVALACSTGAYYLVNKSQVSADTATTTQSTEFNIADKVNGNYFHCTAGPNFQFGHAKYGTYDWSSLHSYVKRDMPLLYGKYHTLDKSAPSSATQFNGLPITFAAMQPAWATTSSQTTFWLQPIINPYFSKVSSQPVTLPETVFADLTFTNGQTASRPLSKLTYNPLNPAVEFLRVTAGIKFSDISKIGFSLQSPDKAQKEVLESCVISKTNFAALAPLPTLPADNYNILPHYGFGLPDSQIKVTQAYDDNISFSEPYTPVNSTQASGRASYQVAYQTDKYSSYSLKIGEQLTTGSSNPDQAILLKYHLSDGSVINHDLSNEDHTGSQTQYADSYIDNFYLNDYLYLQPNLISAIDIYRVSISNPSQQKLLISLNNSSFSGESSASKNPDYSALPIIIYQDHNPLTKVDPKLSSALQYLQSFYRLTSYSTDSSITTRSMVATYDAAKGSIFIAQIRTASDLQGRISDRATEGQAYQALDNPADPLADEYLVGKDYGCSPAVTVDIKGTASIDMPCSFYVAKNPEGDVTLPEKYTALIYKKDGTQVTQGLGQLVLPHLSQNDFNTHYDRNHYTFHVSSANLSVPINDISRIDILRVSTNNFANKQTIFSFSENPLITTPTVTPSATVSQTASVTPSATATVSIQPSATASVVAMISSTPTAVISKTATPAVSIALNVTPSNGTASDLFTIKATVNDPNKTYTSTNYSFWWNCNNTSTSVAATIKACGQPRVKGDTKFTQQQRDIGFKADNVFTEILGKKTITNTFQGTKNFIAGKRTIKVIVERRGQAIEKRLTITVKSK